MSSSAENVTSFLDKNEKFQLKLEFRVFFVTVTSFSGTKFAVLLRDEICFVFLCDLCSVILSPFVACFFTFGKEINLKHKFQHDKTDVGR